MQQQIKIIIIQLARFGDLVQTLPLIKGLKSKYSLSHISLISLHPFSNLIADIDFIDEHIKLQQSDLFPEKLKTVASELKSYDILYNLTNNSHGQQLASFINAKSKQGMLLSSVDQKPIIKGYWFKYYFSMISERKHNSINLVDLYLNSGKITERPVHSFFPVKSKFNQINDLNISKKIKIGLHLSASKEYKSWPLTNFILLAKQLLNHPDSLIILTGSKNDCALSQEFLKKLNHHENILDLTGQSSIEELPALLSQLHLFLSCDTGPAHIAASQGTKTLTLYFSSVYHAETIPYGQNSYALQYQQSCSPCAKPCKNLTCKNSLSPDIVYDAVNHILQIKTFDQEKHSDYHLLHATILDDGTQFMKPPCDELIKETIHSLINRSIWTKNPNLLKNRDLGKNGQSFITNQLNLYRQYQNIINQAINQLKSQNINSCFKTIKNSEQNIESLPKFYFKNFHQLTTLEIEETTPEQMIKAIINTYQKLLSLSLEHSKTLKKKQSSKSFRN